MAYPRNLYSDRYQVAKRDMLAYGYKYDEPWGEDRRAVERAFYGIDRRDRDLDSRWPSYRSPHDGRRGHSGSVAGRHRSASNGNDEQSLVSAMKMVKIGAGKSHDDRTREDNRSASGRRSRSDISASSSIGGRVAVPGRSASDGYQNDKNARYSYNKSDVEGYEGKGKSRAAVPVRVGRPGILRATSSYQSDDSDLRGRNEWFNERDTLHSKSGSSSGDYPSPPETHHYQARSQGLYGHGPDYDTYHQSQVLPVYGYGYGHGHGYNYRDNASYGRSDMYSASYPRTRGYTEDLGSIYEDWSDSDDGSFGDYSESDDDYYYD